jgi:lysophospholipase L1-like esterase
MPIRLIATRFIAMRGAVVAAVMPLILLACSVTPGAPVAEGSFSPSPTSATADPGSPSSSPGASLTYAAFGDSWPYGSHCGGCRPFPVLLEDGLKEALAGRELHFMNDVTNGGTAQELARSIETNESIRADIAAADIIVIAIGGNDLEPAFDASKAGTCGGTDQLDCFRSIRDDLRASYERMLTAIDQLRDCKPTAIRMITGSNEFLADQGLIDMLGSDFGPTRGVAVTEMLRDAQCEVAAAHHALCVDLGTALNGPDLKSPQDVNTQDAMQKVADTILAAGLSELAP